MLGKLRKMLLMKRLGLILIILTVAGTGTLPLDAKNKKGDKLVAEGRAKEAGLTPQQTAKKQAADKLATIQPVPELKPLKTDPINLVLRNQPPKVLYETVGKVAGINVLFDPDFVQQSNKPLSIDITNST